MSIERQKAQSKRKHNCKVITLCSIGILFSIGIFVMVISSRGYTEKLAYESAYAYADNNSIAVERMTCAGDSDGDGYGTCNIVTMEKEKIRLSCPASFIAVKIFGATGCKEDFTNFNLGRNS